MVKEIQFYGQEGMSSVHDDELVLAKILLVSKEDTFFYQIDGTPSDGKPEFQHDSVRGDIIFDPDMPFERNIIVDADYTLNRSLPKIKVVYQR